MQDEVVALTIAPLASWLQNGNPGQTFTLYSSWFISLLTASLGDELKSRALQDSEK